MWGFGADRSRVSEPFLTDTVGKVFWGWRTKFSRTADAFRAQRCEGPTSLLRKTTTNLRIGAMGHRSCGVVQKSTFARFLASFDFRLFQQYRPVSARKSRLAPGSIPVLRKRRSETKFDLYCAV